MPEGTRDKGINQAGVDHYNKWIDMLVANNITPFVTLYLGISNLILHKL